jgi:RNA polymerase sigma-70 factor (ECF subfamily)
MVYRLCRLSLRSDADAEDAVQSVFLKLLQHPKQFQDPEHEKAWLITAARNHCRDLLRSPWRSRRTNWDDLPELSSPDSAVSDGDTLRALLALPEKYKTLLYLYYYEGYRVRDLSRLLGRKESTLQTQLAKGRALLKLDLLDLGGMLDEEANP